MVKVKKSGQYCCDNDCANWRSLGICAHSVAAAEREGKLELFVKWFKKAKRVTNLTKLATTNMPRGRGRKGGVPPSRRKKKAPYTQRVPFDFTDSTSEDEVSTDMSRGRGHKCGVAPSKRKQKAPPKRKQKAPSKGKQKAPIHFTGNTSEEEVTRGNGKEKAQGALFSTDLSDSEDDIIPTQKASRMYGGHGSSFSPRKDAENTQGHEASVSGTGLEPSWYSHEDFHMSQDGTFSRSIREPSRTQVMSWPCGTTCHACASEDAMSHNITLSSGATGHIETRREVVSGTVPSVPPPPPLIPYYSPGGNSGPFTLTFIVGNISICRGCRQKFSKPPRPPNDLCVRHQEWQEFTPRGFSTPQRRFGNVYYHCNVPCILARCPQFTADKLQIPPTIIVQMLPVHTQYIQRAMPGCLRT